MATAGIERVDMTHMGLLTQLVIAVAAAFVGGFVARLVKLPVVIGYIVAGMVVALTVPQIGTDGRGLAAVAELGVALLIFVIGVELSLPQFLGLGRTVIQVAVLQILLTVGLGVLLGSAFGYNTIAALALGFAIALSSTAVVLKSLEEHGQATTRFGQVMLGILITQDLAVVLMLALLPILGNIGGAGLSPFLAVLGRSILFLVVAVLVALPLLPRLLNLIARIGSRELFALTIVAVSFAAAYATHALGFSVALGAFIAGLIVGESEYTHQVFAEIAPLRDIFAAVFFVSIGTTFRPTFLTANAAAVVTTLSAVVVGKFALVFALILLFRQHHKVAFLAAIGLAQMGEFSFLIARDARSAGVIASNAFELVMTVTLLSIIITPLLIYVSPTLYQKVFSIRPLVQLSRYAEPAVEPGVVPKMRNHVIILGFGTVGQLVGAGLHTRGIPYIAIDYNRDVVRRAAARGIPAIYGDAANPLVIRSADPKYARAAVVALPDSLDTWLAVRHLQEHHPDLRVIARAAAEVDVGRLYAEGAEEVVNPRYEAGLEMLRHLLITLRVPAEEREAFIERMRHWEPPHEDLEVA